MSRGRLATTLKGGWYIVTIYETLTFAVAFAMLVVMIIAQKNK